ncbi:formate dehydrogenase accessory sulfurtransferase FdhD [Hydrogenophaga sp. 5NK40-0174]|uniref:formate dehydrogenase accessory sulfurtransferase FdhD n=1 Tax=Hydrogenophaga sp. 5NK40-0174 TaxID=3127649 RepID=UPI003106136B
MKPADVTLAHEAAVRSQLVRDVDGRELADWLAEEVPVAIVVNGISHAVMMASPTDLQDFAFGFLITEGLVSSASDIYGVDVKTVDRGIELQVEVSAECEWRLRERRRSMAGRTGCGLCGTDSLDQVRQSLPTLNPQDVNVRAVLAAHRQLPAWQALQQATGATHAAAWCDLQGKILLVREDVGRHNALDKVLGAMVRDGLDPQAGFVCVTSRASFEMVQKSAMAGVTALAAVSAPTAMAVDLALSCGMWLAGFVRGERLVQYAGQQGPKEGKTNP